MNLHHEGAAGAEGEQTSNFAALGTVEPLLSQLGTLAERYSLGDPNTALLKLRQYGELLTRVVAARSGQLLPEDNQHARLARLRREGVLPQEVWQLLTELRRTGNEANHEIVGEREQALSMLQFAWILGVWLIRTFHDPSYQRGEFIVPQRRDEAGALRALLTEAEQARDAAEQRLARQQAQTGNEIYLSTHLPALRQAAQAAAGQLDLTEAQTRQLIDAQLRAAGWEADTARLRFGGGTRPEKGRNLAIAEWPTDNGVADYALFAGLTPVGVVEAKRKGKAVMGSLEQAARYSRGFRLDAALGLELPRGPWGEERVPFLYATNGRPYLRQIASESGIWFRDARRAVNPSIPLRGWHTPWGLLKLLEQDTEAAEARLREEPLEYDLGLRPYQKQAITAVEAGIAQGRRELLLAMATGTGKTKTAIALIYRLLGAGRFRRALFLVDRETLGEQAGGDFKTARLEGARTFADTFGLKTVGEGAPDDDTAVQVATVQGMVRRILAPGEAGPPPVDLYDLIVVDEAHRGYTLDRDMAEAELDWRGEADFVSKYRQVLDHFDAVKIALTATPALHTTQIFGLPVFAYTYREAVLDEVLIDHEPPHLIETELSQSGIRWKQGERIGTYTPGEDEVKLYEAPDDIGLDVEDFNRRVIAEGFNRAVCRFLAAQLSPDGPEKTLIFCVNDRHADDVVRLLGEAFRERLGEVDDGAVVKITGASDRPLDLIRRFRNEHLPAVAVTVDLLTTGVDVPAITSLVFLRRVGSRILFEQMLGRATRRCDDIGKKTFRIYDAVRAYEAASAFSTMQPVVTQPQRSFAHLARDLLAAPTPEARALLQGELAAKLQRVRNRLTTAARDTFEGATGLTPEAFVAALRAQEPDAAPAFVAPHREIMALLDGGRTRGGQPVFISEHDDAVTSTEQRYPSGQRPEDYLSAFQKFIAEHQDEVPALVTVLTRPGDLTRASLRELLALLDQAGFSEAALQSAYARVRQVDAAATIVGFIRAAAEGEAPRPFDARVDAAVARMLGERQWSPQQKQWLARIGAQLKANKLLDRDLLDAPANPVRKDAGGFDRLSSRVFDGQLPLILSRLQEAVWARPA